MNEENKGNRQQKRTVTALLILKMGKATLKTFKLFSDDLIVTIGRHENNAIRLKDDKNVISRSHAAILKKISEENIPPKNGEKSKEDPQFFIRDLVSSHGTRVNGRYVRKKLLREGDMIRIDDYIIEFTRRDLTRKPRGKTIDQDDEFGLSGDPDAPTKLGSAAAGKGGNFTDAQKEVLFSFTNSGLGVDPSESPKEFVELLLKAITAERALIGFYDGEVLHVKYHKGYEREHPDDIRKEFLDELRNAGFSFTKKQLWLQFSTNHFLALVREKPPAFNDQDLNFLHEIGSLLKKFNSKSEELIANTPWPDSVIGLGEERKTCLEIASERELDNRDVLLLGETGTGKEVMARFIHDQSSETRNGPFIAVNLSSLPEGMIHSQLFGHEKGVFTDASDSKEGYFQIAKGGTLFIDEVGDLPMKIQTSLLTSMENRTVLKLGSKKPEKFNCRIIAATNRDLEKRINSGEFRSDLRARFTHVLHLPPLRKRMGDLPLLVSYYIDQFSAYPKGISREAMEILRQYEWRDNVREVRTVIIHALNKAQETIFSWDLPGEIRFRKDVQETVEKKKMQSLEEGVKNLIEEVLAATHGNVKKALEILKIPKSTLYKMMKDMGIPVGYGRKT